MSSLLRRNDNDLAASQCQTQSGVPGTAGPTAARPVATGTHLPGPAPHTAGPHRHDILNKLDPTVDSQSGGIQIIGPGTRGPGWGHAPASVHGPARTQHTAQGYGPQHGSSLANVLDPRVDSSHQPAASGALPPGPAGGEGTYGPHESLTANTFDSHVGAGRGGVAYQGGTGAYPQGATAPGPARNTAGPHRSDWMNKLDPTVNSKPAHSNAEHHRSV